MAIGSLRTHQLRQVALAFVLFIVLAAIHRMGFLVFFVIVAYMFAVPFHKLTQRLRFALYKYERVARYAFVLTTMGSFIGVFYVQFLYPGVGGADVAEQYGSGAFFHGDSFPVLLANMGVSLTGKVGPLFPVALVGLVAYTWRRPKEATDKFVLTTMLLFLPLLSLRDYMGEFLIPLFTILVVIGLVSARRFFPKRGKLVAIGLAVLVIASVGFSWEMKDYWRERYVTDAPIEDGTYDAAVYLRFSTDETIIANEGLGGGQLAAISGRPVLPIGGASQHWRSPVTSSIPALFPSGSLSSGTSPSTATRCTFPWAFATRRLIGRQSSSTGNPPRQISSFSDTTSTMSSYWQLSPTLSFPMG